MTCMASDLEATKGSVSVCVVCKNFSADPSAVTLGPIVHADIGGEYVLTLFRDFTRGSLDLSNA